LARSDLRAVHGTHWDGLWVSGFIEFADTVNARFRALCELSGFADYFDASTGAGLRDQAYTGTAAIHLLFAVGRVRRNPLDSRATRPPAPPAS